MKCPRCDADIQETDVKSIKIDRCVQCGGTWYDAHELRLLKDKERNEDYRWIDFDLWKDKERFLAGEQEQLSCPRDRQTMTTVRYGDFPIRVDICTGCKGIWLDGGEYRKIVDYLEKLVSTQTAGEYLQDVKEEFIEIFTGSEGLRSELADFAKVLYLLQLRFAVQHPDVAAALERVSRGVPGT